MAIATIALATVTFLLVLEARAARHASTDRANVTARLTLGVGGDVLDAVYLENLGPALAKDVTLTFEYLDVLGVAVSPVKMLSLPTMASGERQAFLPAMVLERNEKKMVPSLDEQADLGYRLKLAWSWSDTRHTLGLFLRASRQQDTITVDLASYRDSVTRGPLMLEPDVLSVLQGLRRDLADREFKADARRRFADDSETPPFIVAEMDEVRLRRAIAVWRARFDRMVLRRRGRPPGKGREGSPSS